MSVRRHKRYGPNLSTNEYATVNGSVIQLSRACFPALPKTIGVTASLKVDYRTTSASCSLESKRTFGGCKSVFIQAQGAVLPGCHDKEPQA